MQAARADQQKRTVEVNRTKLVDTLNANKVRHVAEFEEAVSGYRESLLKKLEEAYESAKLQIDKNYLKKKEFIAQITDEQVSKQPDSICLCDPIYVQMKTPKSHEDEYDAAIAMAAWDVRDTLELTHAEFTCFVRDKWDWTREFFATSEMYKAAK